MAMITCSIICGASVDESCSVFLEEECNCSDCCGNWKQGGGQHLGDVEQDRREVGECVRLTGLT